MIVITKAIRWTKNVGRKRFALPLFSQAIKFMMYKHIIIFIFLFLSCTNKVIYWPQEIIESNNQLNEVSLITDALIIRVDKTGNKYLAKENSAISSEHSFSAIDHVLKEKNYSMSWSSNSFQGAFLQNKSKAKEGASSESPPFQIDTTLFNDKNSLNAFLYLHRTLYMHMKENKKSLSSDFLSSIPQSKEACSAIRDKVGTRYLVLNVFYGMYYSKDERIAKGVGTAVLSSILSFGRMTVINTAPAVFKNYSFFIDLETTNILWSKYYKSQAGVLHGNNFMLDIYKNEILKDLPVSTI